MEAAVVLLPLLGAFIAGFFGRMIGDKASMIITCSFLVLSSLISWYLFFVVALGADPRTVILFEWVTSGDLEFFWSLKVDTLTAVMLVVVTTVSAVVHIYSVGYMHHDDAIPRFFAYLSLFTFSMLMRSNSDIRAHSSRIGEATLVFLNMEFLALTITCLLLFIGAMGKSAQIGLHTWLPDAMEGPTPVSALIHAATMVTAGVFMVVRLSPLFEQSETALMVVTIVGASTAFMAATIGLTQYDIKRVIAYSTCSQLGYMFFAAGVSAYRVNKICAIWED